MKIRLNKVQKELNVGLSTIVEFLQKNNFEIEENPNAVVPEEGYNLLIKEFSTDKNLRIQSDKFTQERQNKEKPKSVSIEVAKEAQPKERLFAVGDIPIGIAMEEHHRAGVFLPLQASTLGTNSTRHGDNTRIIEVGRKDRSSGVRITNCPLGLEGCDGSRARSKSDDFRRVDTEQFGIRNKVCRSLQKILSSNVYRID